MTIKVVLRNPLDPTDLVDYTIRAEDHALAQDWQTALKNLLQSGNLLEKNFCFMGFPNTARTLDYLCNELNQHVTTINAFFPDYRIEETFSPDNVMAFDYADNGINHKVMNVLHNHFEILQGTVWNLSDYYRRADYETKYAIRQLINICHEMENLVDLEPVHRQGFVTNGYDRVLGGVYMHWTQIGKTLFEVFRDEGAPELTDTVCEAITELRYYSGEFDVEWGNDVVRNGGHPWHDAQQRDFEQWLIRNGQDIKDPTLSLGYLPLGQVDLRGSFGTAKSSDIWEILSAHLDIYCIEIDGVSQKFNYCWTDANYKQMQIDMMKPGYDHSTKGARP